MALTTGDRIQTFGYILHHNPGQTVTVRQQLREVAQEELEELRMMLEELLHHLVGTGASL